MLIWCKTPYLPNKYPCMTTDQKVLENLPHLKFESNEAPKIKISNSLGSSDQSAFFQIAHSSSIWGPLDDLKSKNAKAMTQIKI